MTQERLSNEEFLEQVKSLLSTQASKAHGSLFLTQKRLSHQNSDTDEATSSDSPLPKFSDLSPSSQPSILIRATNGKSKENRKNKIKIATVVKPDDLEGFFGKYAEVCRTGMTGLKKRDKSKAKRKKKKGGKDKA